jgi:centromere protein C
VKGSPSKAAVLPAVKSNSKLRHSLNRSPALFVSAGEDDEVQDLESNHNDSFQMQPFPDNDDARSLSRPHSDDEDIPAVVPVNKEKPAAKKTGMGKAPKRRREEEAETDEPPKKKGRPRKNDTQTDSKTASTSHKTTKEVKRTSLASDSSPVIVQRGPPRPKNNNGLYILRREGPEQGLAQTRAGRQVRKPLEYWKGDRMEIKYEPTAHDGKEKVYFPVVKSVMRAEQIAPTLKKPSRKHGAQMSKRSKSVEVEEEEDELEDWEAAGGSISLDIREWDPTDPTGIETADTYAEVALSSGAIVTKQIPGANFMFAKTLTLPFFGSGMVDLPPGSIKRPKNTRKMQMVFFVFVGRVNVMVNDSTFRIGKGGMFQVPRGMWCSDVFS